MPVFLPTGDGKGMWPRVCVEGIFYSRLSDRGGGGGLLPKYIFKQTPQYLGSRPPPPTWIRILRDTVNKRAIRILLECTLVYGVFTLADTITDKGAFATRLRLCRPIFLLCPNNILYLIKNHIINFFYHSSHFFMQYNLFEVGKME